MASILYYVSGHGFGHAVRSARVVRELSKLGHRCEIVSSAPRYIFDANLKEVTFGYHSSECDPGVAQVDSLKNNIAETRNRWEKYLAQAEKWLDNGMRLCGELKPSAIVSDTVPLACVLARRAGAPSFLVTTFTWDWILDFYRDDDPAFIGIAAHVREWYQLADNLIYTPFAYGLPDVRPAHKVSLIGKRAALPKTELRRTFGLDGRPAFLVSFGGCGANGIEKMGVQKLEQYQFVFMGDETRREGNRLTFSNGSAVHEDLLAACDAVITKPGYGVCTECTLNRTPMLYTTRGKFAEYDPLVREMQSYFPAVYIPQKELFNGGLGSYLENIPPFTPEHKTDSGTGAEEAARPITAIL
ncbi:MAG: hypothetical protein HZA04_00055 [Nitrospinae bacterium]|nr:hypothetical protein [Nitrospinota bacterium]